MDKETEHILRGLIKQQPQAQQQALALYGRMVFTQVVRMVHTQEDAEEIYQDVFVKVFNKIDSYKEEDASLATWINRIAYNESVSFLRRKHDNIIYVDDQSVDFNGIKDNKVDETFDSSDEETISLIEQALEFLPPSEKALITMFYFDDMSIKEIAFVTESTTTAVAQKLSRTRKKLYHILRTIQNDGD